MKNKYKVSIIDYQSGNLHSALKAFQRVSDEMHQSRYEISLINKADELSKSDFIILPGVGAFDDCKKGLLAIDGMMDALEEKIIKDKVPFLGICVGMQLMADIGRENGNHSGFSWIKGEVNKITPTDNELKIPHMGWNNLVIEKQHPIFDNMSKGESNMDVYFVHSFHYDVKYSDELIATTNYGGSITAAIAKENLIGFQFHPEKSQHQGMKLINNFLCFKP